MKRNHHVPNYTLKLMKTVQPQPFEEENLRLQAEVARLRKYIEEAKVAFDEIYDSPDSNLKIMRTSEEASDKLRTALEVKL